MEIRNVSNGNNELPRVDRTDRAADATEFPAVQRDVTREAAATSNPSRLAQLRPPDAAGTSVADAARQLREQDEDRLEVSKASEALAAEEDPELVTRRRAQVEAIREALAEGRLVTPERVEQAVRRLLGA